MGKMISFPRDLTDRIKGDKDNAVLVVGERNSSVTCDSAGIVSRDFATAIYVISILYERDEYRSFIEPDIKALMNKIDEQHKIVQAKEAKKPKKLAL